MEITRFTDVGLRIVMRLACDDSPVTSHTISEQLGVPYSHVAKVVARLAELGMVHARRGRGGGLAITASGRSARVGRLARELEGNSPVIDCDHPQQCPLRSSCLLKNALAQAQSAFFDDLDRHTVDDLVTPETGALLLTLGPHDSTTIASRTRKAHH